jgi:hypothetical protein
MKCEKGTKVHLYTDGERAYIEKLEEPKIWIGSIYLAEIIVLSIAIFTIS